MNDTDDGRTATLHRIINSNTVSMFIRTLVLVCGLRLVLENASTSSIAWLAAAIGLWLSLMWARRHIGPSAGQTSQGPA